MKYQIIEDFYGNGWHITTDPEDDAIATVWDKADAERLVNLLNGLYVNRSSIIEECAAEVRHAGWKYGIRVGDTDAIADEVLKLRGISPNEEKNG